MSHFTVLVITPNRPTDEVLREALLPFHEYECTGIEKYVVDLDVTDEMKADFEEHKKDGDVFGPEWVKEWSGAEHRDGRYFRRTNPNARWDWYVRGGRWRGMLLEKAGGSGMTGQPGVSGNDVMRKGGVDSCRVDQLDLTGMQADAEGKAAEVYDKFHKVLAGRSVKPWKDVLAAEPNVDKAREIYFDQEAVKDLKAANLLGLFIDLEDYLIPRDEYLTRARNGALQTFAVLKDGNWYERGKMGWWGAVSDEKDGGEWSAQFTKLLEGLPGDTWLTVVDCHI